jgi:DNA-binding CsgD family transcriptional regulator
MTGVRSPGWLGAFTSGQPLVTCDGDLRVVGWNAAAEELTGIPARDAIGRGCWEVVDAVDPAGAAVCRRGCLHGRLARAGCAVGGREALVPAPGGRRRVFLSTVTLRAGGRLVILHLLQPASAPQESRNGAEPSGPQLTARQREVLALLCEGVTAKAVARRLGIRETTVRNHIHAILAQLGCHSQLEAIARARRDALI